MKYTESGIVGDVKAILDENMDSGRLVMEDDVDTLSLDAIIKSNILRAVEGVVKEAPARLLGTGLPFGDDIIWRDSPGRGPGYVILPVDFLRLIAFQMSDWARPVGGYITEDDPLYPEQQSRYPGIRGNVRNPVLAVVQDAANLILEFYSCEAGDGVHIRKARYLPYPAFDKGGRVEIPRPVYTSVLYRAAALTCTTLSAAEPAQTFMGLSKMELQ